MTKPAMPDLSRWPDADTLLERALDLPRDRRDAFIERVAAGDAALSAALHAVLREDDRPDDFLSPGGALRGGLFEGLCDSAPETNAPTLAEGRTLGPYRVDRCIGRGGMGEVYRARDTRLARDVALKILPDALASDPNRLARLQREARVLAAISHPGIGAIFDVYEDDDLVALVLELVDGPTLADRLANGALPMDDALAVARQLVDAIEAAHQRGIVHRDLKPPNVKVAAGGAVKILDFGLARAVRGEPDDAAPRTQAMLPSITMAEPQAMVLGTAPYMSPEQVRGQQVDHRTDIWAFGCLLYEMITGRPAFAAATRSDTLAKILERDPEWDQLPPSTSPSIVRLIERCLQKDLSRRLGYIGDARLDLDDAVSGRSAGPSPHARWRGRRAMAAGLLGLCAGAAGVMALMPSTPAAVPERRLAVPLPHDHELVIGQLDALDASRDGRIIVYRARYNGVMQLFARSLDSAEVTAIAGTDEVEGHAVSPDGRWVAFSRSGRVYKTLIDGGPPVALCDMPPGITASWGLDGTIVFSSGNGATLFRVAESGGAAVPVTHLDPQQGDRMHRSPSVSPDGTIAFTITRGDRSFIAIVSRTGQPLVLTEGQQPHFVRSDLLVFARERNLWAVRYDGRRQQLASEPLPIVRGVERSHLNGHVHFAVAGDGVVLYVPTSSETARQALVWRNRQGREEATEIEGRGFVRFALSPDASRVAVAMSETDAPDIWIFNRERKTFSRLTFDPAHESAPLWSPDGRQVAYRSDADGGGIVIQPADGAGTPRRLTRAGGLYHIPYAFTPDGRQLIFVEFRNYRDQDIFAVTTDDTATVTPVLRGPGAETRPAISPDGQWIAYQSDESGREEVYLRPWPRVDEAKWQVSANGGSAPLWRRDGRELFFAEHDTLMATAIRSPRDVRPGAPQQLFSLGPAGPRVGPLFDVSHDGRRFLVLRDAANGTPPASPQVHLVMNWEGSLAFAPVVR